MISFRNHEKFDKDATIIFIDKEQVKQKDFLFKDKNLEESLVQLIKEDRFSGEKDEVFPFIAKKNKLVLFVGVGKSEDQNLTALRITVKKALASSYLKKCEALELITHSTEEKSIIAIIEGIMIGTYKWEKYKSTSKDSKSKTLSNVTIVCE
ncbi:MAG: hypothetical protein JNN05_08100, partial [Candidatus Omnitrophica bacterium]|nr:hypothetical protein [Candidatus Omnitrophota bacterium]